MKAMQLFLVLMCFFAPLNHSYAAQVYQQVPFQRVAWSHDGETIAVVSATGVRLFDAATHERVLLPLDNFTGVNMVFSPDDRLLALIDDTGRIGLWEVAANQWVKTLDAQASQVDFSPDGTRLISAGYQEMRLWDVATGEQIHQWEFPACPPKEESDHCGAVRVAFSPDGQSIVTLAVSSEGEIKSIWQLWDAETWEKTQEFVPDLSYIPTNIVFNPDGKTVLVGDGIWMWLWDVEANTIRQVEQVDTISDEVYDLGHQWGISVVAVSADGSRFASGGYGDGTLQFYDGVLEKETTFVQAEGSIYGLALSPDGTQAATVNDEGVFQLWDAATGELLYTHRTEL